MASTNRLVAHDHFVYLLEKEEFENLPTWLTNNFNVIEGGTHAGGSSRNKLIIFKDGTYLELFNWISEPTEFGAWIDKPPGLIDFALTSLPPTDAHHNFIALSQALDSGGDSDLGISFDQPRAGGRKRKDGVDVKWETTRAVTITAKNTPDSTYFPTLRLDIPFFCHDITARDVRVPFDDDKLTTHPCGAVGIADVEIAVPQSHLEHYATAYKAVLGISENQSSSDKSRNHVSFNIPAPIPQNRVSTVSIVAVPELLGNETDKSRRDWLSRRGVGMCGLTLAAAASNGHDASRRGLDGTSVEPTSVFILE